MTSGILSNSSRSLVFMCVLATLNLYPLSAKQFWMRVVENACSTAVISM